MLDQDEILCERIWDMMFSEAAICGYGRADRRAAGIPGIMNAISMSHTSNLLTAGTPRTPDLLTAGYMPPHLLIGHLLSIGWAGRMKFAEGIRVVYSQWRVASGG